MTCNSYEHIEAPVQWQAVGSKPGQRPPARHGGTHAARTRQGFTTPLSCTFGVRLEIGGVRT